MAEYESYARVTRGIEALLEERYGVAYALYASDDGNSDYWDLLEEDVKSGSEEVECAGRIYEGIEGRTFAYDEDSSTPEYTIHPAIRNNVFVYPQQGVALARIPMFRQHGIYSEDFVFATGDEAISRFLSGVRTRQRNRDKNQITVFTDTNNGIHRESEPITRAVSRGDVILPEPLKKEIYRSLDQFFESDRTFYHKHNLPFKRGILLYGRPGNGKTTLVKSIAGSVPGPAAYWQITEYTSSGSVQEVFETAARLAPMVLVIEDIDSMPQGVRSFFLNTLDGATSKEGIFLIGTTNYPEKIDPGLMNRAGRFDRSYEISLPDADLRRMFLERRGLLEFVPPEELDRAISLTKGFSMAQLGELYVSAALEWNERGEADIAAIVKSMGGEMSKEKKGSWLDVKGSGIGFQL
ncbi:ATP-binding protein [Saccharibacillus sp. CPCC 101409]|uniref:ATP-binding protein n=1 Tax=Saccharibacillus sp. CPCC 101409 TaxID=3058041 RepID=UPI0026733685|nr:ATP-binding protein [Saccharibacillus sp. CPCC 101409]MDO3408704.1 ATP-binding protein [Saccharibacillus sp. CPCC 101409]